MKKNFKKIILFAIIISLLIPALTMAGKKHTESDVLSLMLKELNGQFLEGDLNMGGIILDEFISKDAVESMGGEIKTKMGIMGEEFNVNMDNTDVDKEYYSKESIYEENFNHLAIHGIDSKGNSVTVMISSYFDSDSKKGETTLFINFIKSGKYFNISGIIERTEGIFKKFSKPVEITTCIIGTIDGKLKEEDLKKNVSYAMREVKGKVVEEYFDSSISSYTAFTPLIESSIFSGEKKINLNLAIRYNEFEDKTYIWIGTPIITTGY
ncbi:YwmB family TATA-box binding protein [Tissierella sp.]|uniref:YwmB family TATA-box binding protein n=1 Tax=Tissierella sp. TaxID=41274 RepID=UPI002865EDC4|nr:YwmB family TATA-box binding protein [Tissierella sp.]MDR7856940.1 YwmB family TATA-box binding protein [Tissierella sp.]